MKLLNYKIWDLIYLIIVTLQAVISDINSDSLLNHGGSTVNMVEVEENWCMDKTIISIILDSLEKVLASLIIVEKSKFLIMALHNAFDLVPKDCLNMKEVNHVSPKPLPHLYHSFMVEENTNLREGTNFFLKKVTLCWGN